MISKPEPEQVSVDNDMDVQCQGRMLPRLRVSVNLLVSTILHDSDTVTIAVAQMCPQAKPLAMRKSIHGFPFLSYMSMGLYLMALWATGAPLLLFLITSSKVQFS